MYSHKPFKIIFIMYTALATYYILYIHMTITLQVFIYFLLSRSDHAMPVNVSKRSRHKLLN